jgi:predicted ester cyclase
MCSLRGLKGGRIVSAEENKALFRRTYEELLNRGNLDVADELVVPEFINHEAPPGRDRGPESMRGLAVMLRTAFPDLRFEIEELVAEGDVVAGRLTMSGTHEGPLMGMPPTGRSVRQDHMHFVRFQDGKVIEHWGVRDELGMMQQLGVLPERGQPGDPEAT